MLYDHAKQLLNQRILVVEMNEYKGYLGTIGNVSVNGSITVSLEANNRTATFKSKDIRLA